MALLSRYQGMLKSKKHIGRPKESNKKATPNRVWLLKGEFAYLPSNVLEASKETDDLSNRILTPLSTSNTKVVSLLSTILP